MKKLICSVLLILLLTTLAFAQARGPLPNVYASWFTVNSSSTIMTLPFNSRDVTIFNSSYRGDICVNLIGEAFTTPYDRCVTATSTTTIQLASGESLILTDFVTNALSFTRAGTQNASPVSVIVTY